ncbi:MAG: propionate--CoA ligase [Hydrogenophilus sp.]|nr:propionate--CoA ligase [Hydrogenophilus sp.]
MNYESFYHRSLMEREAFWEEEAKRIYWHRPPKEICDFSRPPFVRWFKGGETNLCFNAVDRHAAERPEAPALIWVSTEVEKERVFSYAELQRGVEQMAAVLQSLGVGQGDRVLIYMPMIPEAAFAMLATVRLGAIHSVVFGGFAASSLAVRIDDARPIVMVTADAGMRAGRVIPYKPIVDEACALAKSPPAHVVVVNRGLAPATRVEGRDHDYAALVERVGERRVEVVWVESTQPSYILYTSGTTGRPKGVQRDTGGYAVALAASMEYIFCGRQGETMFTTSDIGWVVGHSYIIYGPLIAGMTTVMYEGTPLRPDPGIWWRLVEKYRVQVMFSAPTAVRVLKKQDPAYLRAADVSSLKHLFLAGEPLDEPTHRWIHEALGVPVVDNYWQTETGWPMLAICRGIDDRPVKYGSPGFPVYGFDVRIWREDGRECGPNEKGVVGVVPPLPPGCLTSVWGDESRFISSYFSLFREPLVYSSADWGVRDEEGYHFILGRTDDVINVAGHRLGTREIEEAVQAHPAIAEVAVVGVHDEVKGQVPVAFAVLKQAETATTASERVALEEAVKKTVDGLLGAIARPARVYFVPALPKTRSGKMLRRSIQAIAEGRDPGDLTTLEDRTALEAIAEAVRATG